MDRSCSTSIFTARTRVTDILIEDNIDCSCGIVHQNVTLFTVKEDQVVKLHTLEAITVGAEVSGIVQFYDQMLPFTMLHIVKRRARTILIGESPGATLSLHSAKVCFSAGSSSADMVPKPDHHSGPFHLSQFSGDSCLLIINLL